MRASFLFVLIAVLVAGLLVAGCPKQTTDEGGTPPPAPSKAPAEKTTPESAAEPASAEFTEDTVRNFMKSMDDQKIEDALNAVAKELGVEDIADTESVDPEQIKQVFDKAVDSKDLDEAVKAHGFSGAKEWVDAAKIIFPGLAKAMVPLMEEMAKAMGIEEGTPEYESMVKGAGDEFASLEGVFPEPTEEQIKIIGAVLKAEMDKGMADAGAGAPGAESGAPAESGAEPAAPEGDAAPAEKPEG